MLACGLRSSASVKAEGEAGRGEGGVFSAFARTSGSSGWDNGTMQTSLGDNVNLDGWVSTRVVDLTSVDLGDRHYDAFWVGGERGLAFEFGGRSDESGMKKGRTNLFVFGGKVRGLKEKIVSCFWAVSVGEVGSDR